MVKKYTKSNAGEKIRSLDSEKSNQESRSVQQHLSDASNEENRNIHLENKPPGQSPSSVVLSHLINIVREDAIGMALVKLEKASSLVQVLSLADSPHFRSKTPILADRIASRGAWAYPGGRHKSVGRQGNLSENLFNKTNKSGEHMRLYHPDVTGFELMEHSFKRVFYEVEHKSNCIYIDMVSPINFIERFRRKMENRVKTLAKREALFHYDEYLSENIDTISQDSIAPNYNNGNILSLKPDEAAFNRVIISKIMALLSDKPTHLQTIKDQFQLGLSRQEAADRHGLSIETVKKRRAAAIIYVRRAFLKG